MLDSVHSLHDQKQHSKVQNQEKNQDPVAEDQDQHWAFKTKIKTLKIGSGDGWRPRLESWELQASLLCALTFVYDWFIH